MFHIGDRVRVKSSQAVGIVHTADTVQDSINQKRICVEFDRQEATRQCFSDEELDPIPPGAGLAASQLMHVDL